MLRKSGLFLIKIILLGFYCSCARSQNVNTQDEVKVLLNPEFNAVGLVYHRFGDHRYPSTNTGVKEFEEHLKYLKENGFKSYTIDALLKDTSSTKKVFITIDDGLRSFYENGLALVKKYQAGVTVFVNTESVGWKDYMTWEQIKELIKVGVQIGNHSHKHDFFLNYPDSIRAERFESDLLKAEQEFKDNLGFVPDVYAFPYGEYDDEMINLLKKRGYKVAFAQNSGVWTSNTNLLAVPRFPSAGEYVKLSGFAEKVKMYGLPITGCQTHPTPLKAGNKYPLHLKIDEELTFNTINCFFDNASFSGYTFKDGGIDLEVKMPSGKRRVILTFTARDTNGKWYWWSHVFVNTDAK